ncbi:MAG: hypothetical protein LC776_04900 [Acidobacteria bacterium]|nr:hypothetical protein [Acidobacteriota bacterium]
MVDDGDIVPIAEEIAHEGLADFEAIERQPALFAPLAQGLLEGHPFGRPACHLPEVQQEAPRADGWSNRRHGVVHRGTCIAFYDASTLARAVDLLTARAWQVAHEIVQDENSALAALAPRDRAIPSKAMRLIGRTRP